MKQLRLRRIVRLAALIALQVVLSRFSSIKIGDTLKFSFGFVPVMLSGAMYGLLSACVVAAVSDVLGAILFPQGAFFIGYTLTAVITALIYALFFHPNEGRPSWVKILLAYVINALVVTIGLNTLCIAFQYGYLLSPAHDLGNIKIRFLAYAPKRAIEAAIMLPLQFVVTYLLLNRFSLVKKLNIKSGDREYSAPLPRPIKYALWLIEAFFITTAIVCDLSSLNPKPNGTALTRYIADYVFTDGLVCAAAFVLSLLLIKYAPKEQNRTCVNLAALLLALAFTLSEIFTNLRAIYYIDALWTVIYLSVCFGAFCLFRLLGACAFKLLDGLSGEKNDGGYIKYSLVIFLCAIPYLIIARPGTLNPDAYDQLSQFMGTLYPGAAISRTAEVSAFAREGILINDTQPVLHTLLLGGIYALFRRLGSANLGITVFVVLQTALFALVAGRSVGLLKRLGLKKGAIWFVTLFYALYPLYPLYFAATLKESALSIALLSSLTFFGELIAFPEESSKKVKSLLAGGISILFCCLIRPFTLLLLLIPALCALIGTVKYGKRAFLPPLIAVMSAFILFAGVKFIVYPLIGVGRAPEVESRALMLEQATLTLEEDADSLTEEERETFEAFVKVGFDPYDADLLKYAVLYEDMDWARFDMAWLSVGLRHPLTYLRAALAMESRYWDLRLDPSDNGLTLYLGDYGRWQDGFSMDNVRATAGVVEISVSESALRLQRAFKSVLLTISRLPLLSLLFKSGTYFMALVILAFFALSRRKKGASLPIALLIYALCLCFGSISGYSRYSYPIIFCAPFVITLSALMPKKNSSKEVDL